MKKAFVVALVLLAFLAGVALAGEKPSPAPNFSLKTADGKTLELKNLQGKVVVVNFWATWCGPCRGEIPGMLKVYDQYKSKGLEIVGISLREEWGVVTPFVQKMKMTYPVVIDKGDVGKAYGGIQYIPTTFIVDRKGNIVDRHQGYMSQEQFESMIKPLL